MFFIIITIIIISSGSSNVIVVIAFWKGKDALTISRHFTKSINLKGLLLSELRKAEIKILETRVSTCGKV